MNKYELKEIDGNEYIEMTDTDGRIYSIPMDPANSDYQAYLEAKQNEGIK